MEVRKNVISLEVSSKNTRLQSAPNYMVRLWFAAGHIQIGGDKRRFCHTFITTFIVESTVDVLFTLPISGNHQHWRCCQYIWFTRILSISPRTNGDWRRWGEILIILLTKCAYHCHILQREERVCLGISLPIPINWLVPITFMPLCMFDA